MKKKSFYIKIVFILVMILILISSCQEGENDMFFKDKDMVYSERLITEVLSAIENKEKDKLISLFSESVRESENFLYDIDSFFNVFNDTGLSFNEESATIAEKNSDFGTITNKITDTYYVTGKNGEYVIFFVAWERNDINKNLEGLFSLRIIKEADYENQYYEHEKMEIPGIFYKPTI